MSFCSSMVSHAMEGCSFDAFMYALIWDIFSFVAFMSERAFSVASSEREP